MTTRRAFVIRGFGVKKDGEGHPIDFEKVHDQLIAPALQRCGMAGGTTTEVVDAGNIRADMFALLIEADLVICDITVHNANVFYELGARHALCKKHTVLIKGDPSADVTPFDISSDRYLQYSVADPAATLDRLVETIEASLRSDRETDSPIYLMMPTLREADPSSVTVVPLDCIEEIERAQGSGDKGWLRVIAEDLAGQRYQWNGLRRVGDSQWKLKDYAGARTTWERLRDVSGMDVEANLALANIYERQGSELGKDDLLQLSNQSIRRVLEAGACSVPQRAEALALEGRNLKTMWRAAFRSMSDPAAVKKAALDARALQSYNSYRKAFYCDLNAYYPGVAALQMGHILLLLAVLPTWRNLFMGDSRQADRAREDLQSELPALAHVVQASVTRAREQLQGDALKWANIADADLLFLTMNEKELRADTSVLVEACGNALPSNDRFAWDSTGRQLALFAQFGLRAEAAQAVLGAFGSITDAAAPPRQHLVVFTGHRIDALDAKPRFPAAAEKKARALIAERLDALKDRTGNGENVIVLASAAPGADILVHELCEELKIPCRLCLPLPSDAVAQHAFSDGDHWRSRFLAIVQSRQTEVFQLSTGAELPRWLKGRPQIDLWERGNRWMMQLAGSWGAQRTTLLALWDGHDTGATGGTEHMVRMAKALGRFEIDVIDSRQLLS